jgi:hypothetical protein
MGQSVHVQNLMMATPAMRRVQLRHLQRKAKMLSKKSWEVTAIMVLPKQQWLYWTARWHPRMTKAILFGLPM